MSKFILGKKLGMTTIYGDAKDAHHVTLVECGAAVSLVRTEEKDGYKAVQVEIQKTKKRKSTKEFRVENTEMKVGDKIGVEIFELGEKVKVSGVTKAKGFQGGVKRHGFSGSPKTHGHKHDLRAPGAIGATTPQHVIKGKRMAGRMGGIRSTSMNLKIVYIDKEKNIIGVKGAVPGVHGTIVEIKSI
ncbi:MAG TPA: 50S ribosomal protein L3 [Candidatus Moranbacteria bacterium]|nr:50S ribosomal protein L3 [Candidatus Moranbacteria bacterium]